MIACSKAFLLISDCSISKLLARIELEVSMSDVKNRTYTVEDIAKILNIGRSSAYNLVKEGHFKIVHIGNAIRISKTETSIPSVLANP